MEETSIIFELREFAEEKLFKYYEIIDKYKINADYIPPIKIEGPEGGKYKKIGDYYIQKNNNEYYITKEKYIDAENNKINAYVYVNAEDGYISNIQYWAYDKTGIKPFVQWNLNDIICGMLFEKSGRLIFASTSFEGKPLITADEASEKIDRMFKSIETKIKEKDEEFQKLISDQIQLEKEKCALGDITNKLKTHDTGVYFKDSLEICHKVSSRTLSAIDKLNRNIRD